MIVLNLYDYFPNVKNVTLYIWVGSCLILMGLSIPVCTRVSSTYTTLRLASRSHDLQHSSCETLPTNNDAKSLVNS